MIEFINLTSRLNSCRYSGGPDLKYSGECGICSLAWRKFQKSKQNQKGGATSRTTSFSDSIQSGNILNLYSQLSSAANNFKSFNRDSVNASDTASTSRLSEAGSDSENIKLSNGDIVERRNKRSRTRQGSASQSANNTL